MQSIFVTDKGQIGFGESVEEAQEDLYDNLCRVSLANDTMGKFKKRREELKPWFPVENMLCIRGVGCLQCEGDILYENKTGKAVYLNSDNNSVYYYLTKLFGSTLTYTDISIVLRPEIDKLFSIASNRMLKLSEQPCIHLNDSFKPKTVYTFTNELQIGISKEIVGIRYKEGRPYYSLELNRDMNCFAALFCISRKMGLILTEEGLFYGKEIENAG